MNAMVIRPANGDRAVAEQASQFPAAWQERRGAHHLPTLQPALSYQRLWQVLFELYGL